MAYLTYPLNNINYNAEDAESYLSTRISGVYANNHFTANVTGDDNSITIGKGIAWLKNGEFKGKVFKSDSNVTIDCGISNASLPRIDVIVIQFTTAKNSTSIIVKKGTPATNPLPPQIVQTESVYELCLQQIDRPAGSAFIRAQDVTDKRIDPAVCGIMRDGVTGIDTSVINAQFNEFIETVKKAYESAIDGTLAGDLQRQINTKVTNIKDVTGIWVGTQTEYDAIATKVATVLYCIKE